MVWLSTSRKPQSGRSGVRVYNARLEAQGLGLSRMAEALVLLALAGLDVGRRWDSIFPSLASPEIVDLGYENIIKIYQKVARSRIVRGTKPLPKRKIRKLRILWGQTRLADHHHHEML